LQGGVTMTEPRIPAIIRAWLRANPAMAELIDEYVAKRRISEIGKALLLEHLVPLIQAKPFNNTECSLSFRQYTAEQANFQELIGQLPAERQGLIFTIGVRFTADVREKIKDENERRWLKALFSGLAMAASPIET